MAGLMHKGRVLGCNDIGHYHEAIKALIEADRIFEEIDDATGEQI